ncbi:MAG: hypothetical protein HKL95_02960, partial [Phycisphaerae bacterium]|nr:hypothetical protein [Phycisphaerae bacterium]
MKLTENVLVGRNFRRGGKPSREAALSRQACAKRNFRNHARVLLILAAAGAVGLGTSLVNANTVKVIGIAGAYGQNGGNAVATAETQGDAINSAAAYGGQGGEYGGGGYGHATASNGAGGSFPTGVGSYAVAVGGIGHNGYTPGIATASATAINLTGPATAEAGATGGYQAETNYTVHGAPATAGASATASGGYS